MTKDEPDPGEEKLLILPLGEESKKITQVISNDTARQIIELLADAPLSASDIAQRLKTPLTTIVYNLENLEKVGLIRVERIKYSEKGREVKIYAPVRKLIVVVPERTDRKSVTDLLRKYVGVILAAVLASSLIEFFMRSEGRKRMIFEAAEKSMDSGSMQNNTPADMINATAKSGEVMGATPTPAFVREAVPAATQPAPAVTQAYAANATIPGGEPDTLARIADAITAHPGMMFLLGCLFAVLLLIIWDYQRRRKNSNM